MFVSEEEMSLRFEKFLKLNFGNSYFKEYSGLFGIPDYVFYSKEDDNIAIISFELKLRDWKKAAVQAFRYKSFSNVSYVVLDGRNSDIALSNIDLFEKYNIGLASFDYNGEFEILHKPQLDVPYSDMLNQKLISTIIPSRKKGKNIQLLCV